MYLLICFPHQRSKQVDFSSKPPLHTAEKILAQGTGLNIYVHFLHSIKGDLFFLPCQK